MHTIHHHWTRRDRYTARRAIQWDAVVLWIAVAAATAAIIIKLREVAS